MNASQHAQTESGSLGPLTPACNLMTSTMKANGAESRSCPRLLLVTGYPPTTVIGGGIILRKLLDDFTNDRLKIISNANVIEALRGRGDHGQLLAVPHFGVRAFGIKVPGIR